MKKIKRVMNSISTFLTVLLIMGILLMLIMQLMGIRPYIVMSGSMEPAIHTGSICFVDTKKEYNSIKSDDIIAFKAGRNTLVTHRVITVTDSGLVTKGDANDVSDGLSTTEDNFIGKTLFSVPYAGYWSMALQTDSGKIIIGTAVGALFLSTVISTIKERKRTKKQP